MIFTCKYDRKCWLACVQQVEDSEIQMALLHPSGPSKSYTYDTQSDILGSSFKTAYRQAFSNRNRWHICYRS